jgi:hypothetical protein
VPGINAPFIELQISPIVPSTFSAGRHTLTDGGEPFPLGCPGKALRRDFVMRGR